MCTLAVLWKCTPVAPLVIAQCRDELLNRPVLDVARWTTTNGVSVVSGRDLLAGGTWFGVGPRVVCGLTNRRDERGPRRGTLSRGDLVVAALEAGDVAAVAADLAKREGAAYGPFSILACDGARMIYADNGGDGDAIRISDVAAGVHVLGNYNLDNPDDPVVRTVGGAARAVVESDAGEAELVAELKTVLARRGEGWPCVSLPAIGPHGYGTRSAGVLVWSPGPGDVDARFHTTELSPDVSPWRDSSSLLTR